MRPTTLALLLALAAPAAAHAQAGADNRLREALRAATAQVRALEDEKAGWAAREAALKTELAALRAAAKDAPPRGSRRETAELRQRLAQQTEAAGKATEAATTCEAARAELARTSEEEKGRVTAELGEVRGRLAAAEAKNERLYRAGRELVDWIAGKGVASALWAKEPFVGRSRVALENALQDHEDRLLEQRIQPPGTPVTR